MSRPNIIFYFSDQQRWDTMGCYGQRLNVTAVLDRMASEGMLFENAFTCQPVCGPARACLQSGMYAAEVGVHTNHRILPEGMDTLALLKKCVEKGVAYVPGTHFCVDGGHLNTIRLNFSNSTTEQIRTGMSALKDIFTEAVSK